MDVRLRRVADDGAGAVEARARTGRARAVGVLAGRVALVAAGVLVVGRVGRDPDEHALRDHALALRGLREHDLAVLHLDADRLAAVARDVHPAAAHRAHRGDGARDAHGLAVV